MVQQASRQRPSREVPRKARLVPSLPAIERQSPDRETAIRHAYATGGYTLHEIGDYFDLHYSTVSRIARGQLRVAK